MLSFGAGPRAHYREHLPLTRKFSLLLLPAVSSIRATLTCPRFSQPQLVPRILPFLAPFVPFLLHQIWPSDEAIAKLPSEFPVLFLAGSRDELVEPSQMKGLWAKCGSKVKEWREFPHGTHSACPMFSLSTFSTCD